MVRELKLVDKLYLQRCFDGSRQTEQEFFDSLPSSYAKATFRRRGILQWSDKWKGHIARAVSSTLMPDDVPRLFAYWRRLRKDLKFPRVQPSIPAFGAAAGFGPSEPAEESDDELEFPDIDYYGLFKISHTATAAEISSAWRRYARTTHPDKTGTDDATAFLIAQAVDDTLIDPKICCRYTISGGVS